MRRNPEPMTPPSDIGVVLATYRGERWLGPMLTSLLAQVQRPSEVVVQDDASDDGTRALLDRFAAAAPFPVRVEVNPGRLGPTRNFERALARSTAPVLALADQDDIWHARKLERLGHELDDDPSLALVFSDAHLVDGAGRPITTADGGRPRTLWEARGQARSLRAEGVVGPSAMARRPIATGCTMVFRRRVLEVALPFPADLHDPASPMGHDRWLGLAATAKGTVLAVDEPLLSFRIHPDQATGVPGRTERARRLARVAGTTVGRPAATRRGPGVRAAQFEEAARRAEAVGAFDEADALGRLAAHEHRRADLGATRAERLRTIVGEVRAGGYDRHRIGAASAAADLARAVRRPRAGGPG